MREGVIEHVFKRFVALGYTESARGAIESVANQLLVWLGPCIGSQAFEVGAEVCEAFVNADPLAAQHFKPTEGGKFLGDLQGLARQRLARLGITQIFGNDGDAKWCTASNASNFFSHRRDRVSGRFAASVWLHT
jgi:polyphenol oxidase